MGTGNPSMNFGSLSDTNVFLNYPNSTHALVLIKFMWIM